MLSAESAARQAIGSSQRGILAVTQGIAFSEGLAFSRSQGFPLVPRAQILLTTGKLSDGVARAAGATEAGVLPALESPPTALELASLLGNSEGAD